MKKQNPRGSGTVLCDILRLEGNRTSAVARVCEFPGGTRGVI